MTSRLVGRGRETDELARTLDRIASSQPAIVVLEGEAGVGKSRLLGHAEAEARRRRIDVAMARADELEQTRPFGLVVRLLSCTVSSPDPRRAHVAALLAADHKGGRGPISVSSDPGLQFRVVDELVDLVEQMALDGPLVLGVDDLQWADPSSLLTLAAIVRRVRDLPVALIACLRPFPRRPELTNVLSALAGAGARTMEVGGLEPPDTASLVGDLIGAAPGPRLMEVVSKAAGNPLFITELLSALGDDGAMAIADGRAEVDEPTELSSTLRLTILRRLIFLSDPALDVLRAGAVLGSSFTLTDLSVTMAQPAIDLLPALAEGLAAKVLEEDGDRLRFRHDLIRDAVYEELPVSVRRGLHREAGQRLAAAHSSVQQVAEQLSRGALVGDAEAVASLVAAGRDAARTSPAVAATVFGRALELTTPMDPGADELRLEVASSLLLSGRIGEAIVGFEALLRPGHSVALQSTARVCLGHALLASGKPADALGELRAAATTGTLGAGERADALAWAGLASLLVGDVDGAGALSEQARIGAIDSGDPVATSVAINVGACVRQVEGRFSEALEAVDEALRRADESPGRLGHRYPLHLSRGHVLIDLDRLDDARAALDLGRRTSDEMGMRWPLASHHTMGGLGLFISGDWDDAAAELEASFALADETGERLGVILGEAVMAMMLLHGNDLIRARSMAEDGVRLLTASGGNPFRGNWALWAHALVLEAVGDVETALAELGHCWDDSRRVGLAQDYPVFGPDLVRLAIACRDLDRAREVSAAVAGVAERNAVASLDAAALRCQGLVDDDPDALIAAVAASRRSPRLLDTALAAEEAGVTCLRHGRTAEGRTLLEDAAQRYQRLEASRDLGRVDAALRAAGVRRGRRGPRQRARHGWPSLTPTEHTVAELVADGLSNPQIGDRLFVSHRTIQTHLSHIFTKLEMTSRVQLTAEITRRRLAEPAR